MLFNKTRQYNVSILYFEYYDYHEHTTHTNNGILNKKIELFYKLSCRRVIFDSLIKTANLCNPCLN